MLCAGKEPGTRVMARSLETVVSQFTHRLQEALGLGQRMLMGKALPEPVIWGRDMEDSLASGVGAHSAAQGI